jgi:hypothetical protein
MVQEGRIQTYKTSTSITYCLSSHINLCMWMNLDVINKLASGGLAGPQLGQLLFKLASFSMTRDIRSYWLIHKTELL